MKLTTKRYAVMLTLQSILISLDLVINVFSTLLRQHNGVSLILFIIQTACLILSLGTLSLTFFSTYAFQAGLVDLLYEKFYLSIFVFLLYFVVTVVLQVWLLVVEWNNTTLLLTWSTPLLILFVAHRMLIPFYYYFYKRASLRISDPRFYEDVWVENRTIVPPNSNN